MGLLFLDSFVHIHQVGLGENHRRRQHAPRKLYRLAEVLLNYDYRPLIVQFTTHHYAEVV